MALGVAIAVVTVLLVFTALLLPRFIDHELIRTRISSELAKSTSGKVTFGKITLLWFPRPAVLVDNTKLSFGEQSQGSIRSLKIYPSIFHLFIGRFVLQRALLREPRITVRLPEMSDQPIDFDALEKQIGSVLARLTRELPASNIDCSDGSAEIRMGDRTPVILENVAAQIVASRGELRIDFSGRSSLWERLKIAGEIVPESLASRLDVDVQRLNVKELLALLRPRGFEGVGQGEASVNVKIASVGLRQVKASIGGSAGPLVFARHGGTATVEIKSLTGAMTYQDGTVEVDIEGLELASPRLRASGQLKIGAGSLSARVKARDVDVAEISGVALQIVDDADKVKRILQYVRSGKINELTFESTGRSLAEMAFNKNTVASGLMRDCKIFLPQPELALTNVSGSVRIAGGVLEAKDITANLGTAKGWNGKLRLGLEGTSAPFHLDLSVHTGAPELLSALLTLVHDEAFRTELLKVRSIKGDLSGRLTLGETIDAISPVIAISAADISADYAPVPFPIVIRGGRLNYAHKTIRVENVQGSVGRSSFGGLGLTWHHDESRQIKIDSRQISLDLQQTDTLLRNFKALPSHFEELKSIRGQIELHNLALTGAYDDPSGWAFASKGTVNQVEIRHADFPDRITLSRGKFDANEGRIIFSDAVAVMSDASLIAGGTFEYRNAGPIQFAMSGTATIGAHMNQWLDRYVELPKETKLRSPLKITAERLAWRAGGDVSFRGRVTVAGGPLLTLDAVKRQQGLAVQNLTVDDGDRRAQIAFQLSKDHLDWSFKGELTQQMIDNVFASFPIKVSSLRGDIQISAALADPVKVSALGQLSGTHLSTPLGPERTLIETFSIEAGGESVVVRSADIRWGKSHLAVSGRVTGGKEILQVALEVTGDQLDWEELKGVFGEEGPPERQRKAGGRSIPDVEGTIRLKTDRFTFERFNLSPLEATVGISPAGVRTEINRGVFCGIDTTGRIDFADKDITLNLQLSATNAQLEPTTRCLTNRQNDVRGTYSLTARITGRGDREHLRSALQGDFQFSAHNGEFVRSPGIDATFDYLNASGDFKVPFPDLDRETFPYRFVGIKGRIEGKMLVVHEINVNSSLLNLSGQGKVDLERRQIDGRGLIAVLKPVDEVISRVPVISSMLSGSLLGIPVRVSGSLDRPDVTYLSPADVGAELLNIPLGILGMPLGAMRLFTPSEEPRDENVTK